MAITRQQRKHRQRLPSLPKRGLLRFIPLLMLLAVIPPVFFHFRLRRFHHMQLRKCGWLEDPPLVCAHGGDATTAAPNTMGAYHEALRHHVDCIEIDVSRSYDGVLFALHDRDVQRMTSNHTMKVGYLRSNEIKGLDAGLQLQHELHNQEVPTIEDALMLISKSVKQVILDAKVGPPLYEKGLAQDILSIVQKTHCRNCLVWAKSDALARDVIKLSKDVKVGYIVTKDPSTGATSNLLRMKGADVVGVYHPLIEDKLMRTLHGRGRSVYAWTVDDEQSMRKMLFQRVDAIVTGHPSLLQNLMQSMKTECLEEGFSLL
ncbi:hypothetical protein Taro_021563 [Colocasia esculenta]|uniref:glycerophosphodiester phosphodiesterase n=1 Tax=Colocasia esculenta TaxID=4460 RepID=A0A843V8K7_COLES|nr:hypothetical protein [Colocasia esculenta]